MEIVGHRGACGHAPENTLKSFSKAIELGCHRVELDIHVSLDQVPVVIHDATLERTTNGSGFVRSLTLAELKSLDAGEGQQIPTLREVMDLCREKVALQIELKSKNSPALVADLVIHEWGPDNVVITSFDLSLLTTFAALVPKASLGLLNKDPSFDMVTLARKHAHRWICPRFDIATPDLVNKAHATGLLVYVYHVNEVQTAQNLCRWKVDAIGTDFPDLISACGSINLRD